MGLLVQMIERAIRELNKDGWGSSEESISNFIRKEYDDLPWLHFTLLKHHLGALCDCGSIIRTDNQHYLLPGTDATLTFGKNCKRRKSSKEQDSELEKRDIDRESVLQKQQCLEAKARKDPPPKEDAKQIDDLERPPGFETVAFEETSNLPVSCTEIRNHELLEVKSGAASRSKQGPTRIRFRIPAAKPSSFKEPHKPNSSSCPAASSLLHLQSQEQVISDSDTNKQRKLKSLTNNGSEHKVHSVQAALPSCTEKQYQAHKFPEVGVSNIEEPSQTLRTQHRKRNRWYKQLLNLKQCQPDKLHQASPLKSNQLTMKQPILDMQVKKNEREKKVSLPSSSDQQEFNKVSSLQMHPKHPPEKRVSQKLSSRLLRPWLLISPPSHSHHEQQQQQKGKPESGIITNDKVMSSPNHHPAGEQHHIPRHVRSRKEQEGKSRCLLWQ